MAKKRRMIEFVQDGNEFENRKRNDPSKIPFIAVMPMHQIRIGRKWYPFGRGILKMLKMVLGFLLAMLVISVILALLE